MRKMTMTVILMFIFSLLPAPGYKGLIIVGRGKIEPFKPLIHAIGMVESSLDTLAYNPLEKAVGYFQCRPIRIKDYNERTGSNYTLDDMFDYKKAEIVFLYYTSQFRFDDFEGASKDWNKSKTDKYWRKVVKYLDN